MTAHIGASHPCPQDDRFRDTDIGSKSVRSAIRLRCGLGGGAERGSALLAVLGALTWPVMVAQPPAAGTTKMQKGWPAGSA
jgi:hypothetical protein